MLGKRLVLAAVLLGLALWPAGASAQGESAPPWPLLYHGEVYVDGEPLSGDAVLTVRVGDWESKEVPVTGGTFRCADPCLIAGPPDSSYIGEPVTFHLNGEHQAARTFAFPALSEPSLETVTLRFGEDDVPDDMREEIRKEPEPTSGNTEADTGSDGVMWGVLAGVGTVAALGAGTGWFVLRRRGAST